MMRLVAVVLPLLSVLTATRTLAHEGHAASPLHIHLEGLQGLPLDLGLITITVVAMMPLVVRAWRNAQRGVRR